jgi:hypothetical protein
MKTEDRPRSALRCSRSRFVFPDLVPDKTEERPGSALRLSRSRFVCTDLVPDAACGGVNEDSGEAWVHFNAFSFQICLY